MSEHLLLLVAEALPWFFPLLMVVLGGVFGSFLSCMTYRVPCGLNPSQPPSYCPQCNTPLGVVDLVPVLSWVFLRGKCRHCGAKFGYRYLLIELATIAVAYAVWLFVGPHWHLLPAFAGAVAGLFVLLCAVVERHLAPRVLLFSLMMLGVIALT